MHSKISMNIIILGFEGSNWGDFLLNCIFNQSIF